MFDLLSRSPVALIVSIIGHLVLGVAMFFVLEDNFGDETNQDGDPIQAVMANTPAMDARVQELRETLATLEAEEQTLASLPVPDEPVPVSYTHLTLPTILLV